MSDYEKETFIKNNPGKFRIFDPITKKLFSKKKLGIPSTNRKIKLKKTYPINVSRCRLHQNCQNSFQIFEKMRPDGQSDVAKNGYDLRPNAFVHRRISNNKDNNSSVNGRILSPKDRERSATIPTAAWQT
uniref:Uncharacterized protein n=1 Tax=Romanomermis culicivorax TaxID=13658 RepID=A0A915L312_ROMCU